MDKANEYAIEALKQIIGLSSGIIALTIAFLKDILGDARASAQLSWLLPVCWVLLLVAIWRAWIAIVEAANLLGHAYGAGVYAFDKEFIAASQTAAALSPDERKRLTATQRCRNAARQAQFSFVSGLLALIVFAVVNLPLVFSAPATTLTPTPTTSATAATTASATISATAIATASPTPTSTPTPLPTASATTAVVATASP